MEMERALIEFSEPLQFKAKVIATNRRYSSSSKTEALNFSEKYKILSLSWVALDDIWMNGAKVQS